MKPQLVAILFVLLVCATGWAADPAKLSVENYNKVVIGANIQYVYGCLGRETTTSSDWGNGEKTLLWKADGKTVSVSFDKNRVVSKWQVGF